MTQLLGGPLKRPVGRNPLNNKTQNMKELEVSILDRVFDKKIKVPSTYNEFDEAVGEEGAALGDAVDNVLYRNTLPRLYKAVSERLKTELSFAKNAATNPDGSTKMTTPKDPKNAKPVYESAIDHIRRFDVVAVDGVDADGKPTQTYPNHDVLDGIFTEECEKIVFYVEGEGGGGGKISKDSEEAANSLFQAGPEAVDMMVKSIEDTVPGYTVLRDEGVVTQSGLAAGIQKLNKHFADQAKKQKDLLLNLAKKGSAPTA